MFENVDRMVCKNEDCNNNKEFTKASISGKEENLIAFGYDLAIEGWDIDEDGLCSCPDCAKELG